MIKSRQLARAIFELATEDEKNLTEKVMRFMQDKKLTAQWPAVVYHLEKIYEQDEEKKGIQLEVAHDIRVSTVEAIKKFLQAENLPETIKIKKELVAGFRAKWRGKIYDASVLTGLKKLTQAIIN